MLRVTVIRSQLDCDSCRETAEIVQSISGKYEGKVEFNEVVYGTPEAAEFGVVSTPVVVLGNKIYSMGKPVIKQKVEGWIKRELGL